MNFIKSTFQYAFRLFIRKSLTTEEELEQITKTLQQYEDEKRLNLNKEKRMAGSFILYSLMAYFSLTAFVILYCKPSEFHHYFFYFAPIISLPFLIYYTKKLIHWFYVRRVTTVNDKIKELKKQKTILLSLVTERETYKKANEILNRYDVNFEFRKSMDNLCMANMRPSSDTESKLAKSSSIRSKDPVMSSIKSESVCDLRQRRSLLDPSPVDEKPPINPNFNQKAKFPSNLSQPTASGILPALPRPLLDQNRTNFDKIVDFIVGDGFSHRYALICSKCHSHNGMALQEEFQFISFKCAYCGAFNKARKVKPDPPDIPHTDSSTPPSPMFRKSQTAAPSKKLALTSSLSEAPDDNELKKDL